MDYKNKYLKYKNKYLALQSKARYLNLFDSEGFVNKSHTSNKNKYALLKESIFNNINEDRKIEDFIDPINKNKYLALQSKARYLNLFDSEGFVNKSHTSNKNKYALLKESIFNNIHSNRILEKSDTLNKNKYLALRDTYSKKIANRMIGGANASVFPVDDEDKEHLAWLDEPDFFTRIERPIDNLVIVEEFCCGKTPTQFAKRMYGCEDKSHDIASYTGKENSFDGIVKISKQLRAKSNIEEGIIKYILPLGEGTPDEKVVSDHNGICMPLTFNLGHSTNFTSNIISFNLEGLCRQEIDTTQSLFDDKLLLLRAILRPFIIEGTIIVCQEIVLQKYKKDTDKQLTFLIDSGNKILTELRKLNPNLSFVNDTFTGGIYYDSTIWEIQGIKTIKRRLPDSPELNKFSNAYLFRLKHRDIKLWITNIHLKAPDDVYSLTSDTVKDITSSAKGAASWAWSFVPQIRTPPIYEPASSVATEYDAMTLSHIFELNNIIDKLFITGELISNDIPIYLCGDFNDRTLKQILVQRAITPLMRQYHFEKTW
jgi:hypothetical protein